MRLSSTIKEGVAISDQNGMTGIYLMVNPTDSWREGYFIVIVAADSNIALCLNDGTLRFRSSGGEWSPIS